MRIRFASLLAGSVLAPAALLSAGLCAHADSFNFDDVDAKATFVETTPGGPAGPTLVYPTVTFQNGVILNDSKFDGYATTKSNLYATSDFYALADGSTLPGLIEADFTTPGQYQDISLDVANGLFAATFTVSAYDAFSTRLGTQSMDLASFNSDGAVGHFSLTGLSEAAYFIVYSNQQAGLTDFAIDSVTLSSPVPEASTTVSLGLLLTLGLSGVLLATRRRKAV